MKTRRTKLAAMLALLTVLVYIFVFNPGILESEIVKNSHFPAGTLISWAGLFLYTLLMFRLIRSDGASMLSKRMKQILLVNTILAACWGFIARVLAGNWLFSFQNSDFNFRLWIGITVLILILPVVIFLLLGIQRLWLMLGKR
ncbi:hypothetical protein [Maribellus mangrovi]|uniref:hypothetical protein n=1 Tax=Maribellus mangrovi TaxID=3133146 RepID=UPI0030EE7E9F